MKERITSPNPKSSVLAAIMPWKGMPGNTAIVSRRLVDSGTFTTLEIKKIEAILETDELLTDSPINTRKEQASKLDADGIVRLRELVTYGDVLIGKSQPRQRINKDDVEEKMLKAIFGDRHNHKDTSVRMPFKDSGVVIDIERTGNRVTVYILIKRELRVGDVLRDDKGVHFAIAEIRETENMPCLEFFSTQRIPDLLIVPPTTAQLSDKYYTSLQFSVMHSLTDPQQTLLRHMPGKKKTKKWITSGDSAQAGYIKVQKIDMLLEQKADAPKLETFYVNTEQVVQGHKVSVKLLKNLADNGLLANLQELLTAKSDSSASYMKTIGKIFHGPAHSYKRRPGEEITGTARMEKSLLECLGFCWKITNGSLQLDINPSDRLTRLSSTEMKIDSEKENEHSDVYDQAAAALSDPDIFGANDVPESYARYGHIALPVPLLNPFSEKMAEFTAALKGGRLAGAMDEGKKTWNEAMRDIFTEMGISPKHTTDYVLVLPLNMRENSTGLNWHYKHTLVVANRINSLIKRDIYSFIIANEIASLQNSLNRLYGVTKSDKKGLLDLLAETNAGLFEKKVSFSAKSLIIADEKLAADECSIPLAIALRLFSPFIQHVLMDKHDVGPKGSEQFVDHGDPEAVQALLEIAPKLCVLLATADQSRLSAFKVAIDMDCEVAKLNPKTIGHLGIQAGSKGKAYIHAPLSEEARAEVQGILFSKSGIKEAADNNAFNSSLLLNKSILMQVVNGTHDGNFILSEFDEIVLGIEKTV